MIKMIEITSCMECRHFDWHSVNIKDCQSVSARCALTGQKMIMLNDTIPPSCPLPDAPPKEETP